MVRIRPGGGRAPLDTYVIEIGDDETSRAAGLGRYEFGGYDLGDNLSIRAKAVSLWGKESPWSASVSHRVVAGEDLPPDVTSASVVRLASGVRRISATLNPAATQGQVESVLGYLVRARPGSGWTAWSDLAPIHDGLITAWPHETSSPLTTGPHVFGFVAADAEGAQSETPLLITVDLGAAYGAGLLAQRLEAALGWPGTKTGAAVVGGELHGPAGLPSSFSYVGPVIDLGADKAVTVAATAYGAAGTATLTMRVGLEADGAPEVRRGAALGLARLWRVVIRARGDVTGGCRAAWSGRAFTVLSARCLDADGRFEELLCEELTP